MLFKYGRSFIDLSSLRIDGLSIWLRSCNDAMFLKTPRVLEYLIKAGCDIEEVDNNGWNCLFHCVLNAHGPNTSKSFEALLYLLSVFPKIDAQDRYKKSISDRVSRADDEHGSYQRDLWYHGLERSGICTHGSLHSRLSASRYTLDYTPQHHRAMRYLDTWTFSEYFGNTDTTEIDAMYPMTEYEAAETARLARLREQIESEEQLREDETEESEDDTFESSEDEWNDSGCDDDGDDDYDDDEDADDHL